MRDLKRDDFRREPYTDGHSRLQQVGQDQKEQTQANVEVHIGHSLVEGKAGFRITQNRLESPSSDFLAVSL